MKRVSIETRIARLCEPGTEIKITGKQTSEEANLYIFEFSSGNEAAVIIYNDGTLFHQRDWQSGVPMEFSQVKDFDWLSESGKEAIVLNGLPRIL